MDIFELLLFISIIGALFCQFFINNKNFKMWQGQEELDKDILDIVKTLSSEIDVLIANNKGENNAEQEHPKLPDSEMVD